MQRRIDPSDARLHQLTSECHPLPRPGLSASWVMAELLGVLGFVDGERVHLELAESASECQMLLGGDVLVQRKKQTL